MKSELCGHLMNRHVAPLKQGEPDDLMPHFL
jgi:hypothetical protein